MDAVIVPLTFRDFVERSSHEAGAFDDIPEENLCVALGRPENICPRCGRVLGPPSLEKVACTSFGYLRDEREVRVYECLRCKEQTLLTRGAFPEGYPLTFFYRRNATPSESEIVLVVPRSSHMLWLSTRHKEG